MLDITVPWKITAPAGVDGFGQIAVLANSLTAAEAVSAGNWVGFLTDFSRSVEVRESKRDLTEQHGVDLNPYYYGAGSGTLEIQMALDSTVANSLIRRDKLFRATNAMAADMQIDFTETGGVAKRILARRQQYPSGPTKDGRQVQIPIVMEDPRIYTVATKAGPSGNDPGARNVGNAFSPPTFTLTTPSGAGTIILENTTAGYGNPKLTLRVGTPGYLPTSTQITVNFKTRQVQAVSSQVVLPGFCGPAGFEVVGDGTRGASGGVVNSWTVTSNPSSPAPTGVSVTFSDAWI